MKILIDENIPFGRRFFERFGDVVAVPGRNMSSDQARDADVLIVRSVTKVNERLLEDSKIQFVGTCTIGIDHLDIDYLESRQIRYVSAPGCNAGGVVQYDFAALTQLDVGWLHKRIGVIGCGNVGGRLCKSLDALGVNFIVYDPLLTAAEQPRLTSLERVLDCDIICMHAPHTTRGPFPTHHMINATNLGRLRPGAILLNAGRGGAIDNQALLDHLRGRADLRVVLDVWEHEPVVDLALMEQVELGSPHIAGYSFEGKINGTAMVYTQLVKHLGLNQAEYGRDLDNLMSELRGEPIEIRCDNFAQAIAATYDITADDRRFRQALGAAAPSELGAAFDLLRKTYPERREFSHFQLVTDNLDLKSALHNLGFVASNE